MVYKNENGHGFLINCTCGCGNGLEFQVEPEDDDVLIFINACRWYTDQDGFLQRWQKKLKNIWFIFRGKEYCYSDLILKSNEWKKFQEYINNINVVNA